MSNKITAILAPNGETIYLQYDEEESDELIAVSSPIEDIQQRSEKLKAEIVTAVQGYSQMILNAVKEGTEGLTPSKVTLAFGLQVGGETGIPFVTKGTAQANVTVTIEWELKKIGS